MIFHSLISRVSAFVFTLGFFVLGGSAIGSTVDLSSHFDEASDYSAGVIVWNDDATTPTFTVTDVGPSEVQFSNSRPDAGKAILSILSSATFNPSTQGALTNIDWATTVEDVASNAIIYPMISQGGTMYMYVAGNIIGSDRTPGIAFNETGATSTQTLTDALASDFAELDTATPGLVVDPVYGYGPETVAASNPDFSLAGGEISFGYLTVSDTGSSGGRTNTASFSNTAVGLDYVPKPSAAALDVTIAVDSPATQATLSFPSLPGDLFDIFRTEGLEAGFGSPLDSDVPAPGGATVVTETIDNFSGGTTLVDDETDFDTALTGGTSYVFIPGDGSIAGLPSEVISWSGTSITIADDYGAEVSWSGPYTIETFADETTWVDSALPPGGRAFYQVERK